MVSHAFIQRRLAHEAAGSSVACAPHYTLLYRSLSVNLEGYNRLRSMSGGQRVGSEKFAQGPNKTLAQTIHSLLRRITFPVWLMVVLQLQVCERN